MVFKNILLLPFFLFSIFSHSQLTKEELFKKDVAALVEEMEFMYGYDQLLREYTLFKSFDKRETDSIELLPDSLRSRAIKERKFLNDTLSTFIFREYVNPKDALHTKRMIAIIKKYGFPDDKRIRKYYDKEFNDPGFSPYLLMVHAPNFYWEDLKLLMKIEFEEGRIDRCTYGLMLWHFTGRKSYKPLLDNGYTMERENGRSNLKYTCK